MKKQMLRILILSIYFFFEKANAQNLVPNWSFEIIPSCPNGPALISFAAPWDRLQGGGGGTPDYFNSCNLPSSFYSIPFNAGGYQYAHSGNAYGGIGVYVKTIPDFREYIQVLLKDSLQAGKGYCVEFYVSAGDNNIKYGADGIGAYFSIAPVSSALNTVLPNIPQVNNPAGNVITDTMNWTKISGSFTAAGGEKYMVIGNFKDDANTNLAVINNAATNTVAYYYIDDVSVSLIEKVKTGSNKSICLNDSIQIGPAINDVGSYSWSPSIGLSNATLAQPIAKPLQTTTYTLTKTTACDISKDTVTVTVIDNCVQSEIKIPNVFSPNNDGTNDVFAITSKNIKTLNCKIYNRWGIEVISYKLGVISANATSIDIWDGRTTAGLECTNGVYYYILTATGWDEKEYKEKGFIQLMR